MRQQKLQMQKESPHDRKSKDRSALSLESVSKPDLKCQQANPITRICLNPACAISLMCDLEACHSCGEKVHGQCNSITFKYFTDLINKPLSDYNKFTDNLKEIEDDFFRQLTQNRNKLSEKYCIGRILPRYYPIIDQVFNKKNKSMTGKQAKYIYDALNTQSKKDSEMVLPLLTEYTKAIKQIGKQLLELQELAYQEYSKGISFNSGLFQMNQRQRLVQQQFLRDALGDESRVQLLMRGVSNNFRIIQMSRMLERYQLEQPTDMFCGRGNQITMMCINPKCVRLSLICDQPSCQTCGEAQHKNCHLVFLNSMTMLLNKRAKNNKDFILSLCQSQNTFFNQLQDTRESLATQFHLGIFKEKHLTIINQIYKNKNKKYLKGKDARQFYDFLESSQIEAMNRRQQLSRKYEKEMKWLVEQVGRVKDIYYQYFVTNKESLKKIINEKVPPSIITTPSLVFEICQAQPSMVASLSYSQKVFLSNALSHPKRLRLLFRASEHKFKASKFHEHCDNIENTLTLIRTEFGMTIGGFTRYKWNQVSYSSVNSSSGEVFLLQLDSQQKMTAVNNNKLICCHSSYGPIFGGGADLSIHNNCNSNNYSYANFPTTYNLEGPKKYINGQQSYTAFCGSTNGYNFRVEEYEVFAVHYN